MFNALKKFISLIVVTLVEASARLIWLMLPLGFHVFMLQMREKVDKLPAINGYFDENSTWAMVYDGVVLVNTQPGAVSKRFEKIGLWFKKTRYRWLVAAVLIGLGCLFYIAAKVR